MARLADTEVARVGLERNRVTKTKFATFAREWLETYAELKGLKRSTFHSYRLPIDRHFIPAHGTRKLDAIDADDLERYVARKRSEGLGPRSLNRHLNLLNELFTAAIKHRPLLARRNPVPSVDRPREPRRRWRILSRPRSDVSSERLTS